MEKAQSSLIKRFLSLRLSRRPPVLSLVAPTRPSRISDDAVTQQRPSGGGVAPLLSGFYRARNGQIVAGKYKLGAVLGQGGSGTVYAARALTSGMLVALKIVSASLVSQDERAARLRLFREHRAGARAACSAVARPYEVGIDEVTGEGYLSMELVEGGSLYEEILRRGALTAGQAADVLVPVMRALARAHQLGVIHRDVKPDNILLSETSAGRPRAVLIDWSIAVMTDDGRYTQPAECRGTPRYMAPEAARDATTATPAVDVWGMGITLYECVTGQAPFAASHAHAVLCTILTQRAPRADAVNPDVSTAVADVIARALSYDPEDRYANLDAMADALLAAIRVPTTIIPPPPVVRRGAGRLVASCFMLTLVSFLMSVSLARCVQDYHTRRVSRIDHVSMPAEPFAPAVTSASDGGLVCLDPSR